MKGAPHTPGFAQCHRHRAGDRAWRCAPRGGAGGRAQSLAPSGAGMSEVLTLCGKFHARPTRGGAAAPFCSAEAGPPAGRGARDSRRRRWEARRGARDSDADKAGPGGSRPAAGAGGGAAPRPVGGLGSGLACGAWPRPRVRGAGAGLTGKARIRILVSFRLPVPLLRFDMVLVPSPAAAAGRTPRRRCHI